MTIRTVAFILLSSVVVGACSDESATSLDRDPNHIANSSFMSPQSTEDYLGNRIAAYLATEMSDIEYQTAIRDLLRSSPWVEHKVSLEHLLTSRVGERALAALTASVNVPADEIQNRLRNLGPLEFYVPLNTHRLSWLPGDAFAVGYVPTNKDTLVDAYLPSGEVVRLTKTSLRTTEYVLFLLQPAESKNKRFGSAVPTSGPHIQDPREFRIGGSYEVIKEDGTIENIEFSDLPLAVRPPLEADLATQEVKLAHTTFLSSTVRGVNSTSFSSYPKATYLNTDRINVGDGVGGACEIYTYQSLYSSSGTRLASSRVPSSGSMSGVDCFEPYWACDASGCVWIEADRYFWWSASGGFGRQALNDGIDPASGEYLRRHVYEDDVSYDDDLGKLTFNSSHDQSNYPITDPFPCYHKDTSGNTSSFYDYCYYNSNSSWEAGIVSH